MTYLMQFFAARPWLALGLLLVGSILAASRMGELDVRVSASEMLVADDPQRTLHEQIKTTFGEEETVVVVLKAPRPLAAEKLVEVREVIDAIEKIPSVERTESLFTVPHVRSVDGYLQKTPYLSTLPEDAAAEQTTYAAALANPLISGLLISAREPAIAIAIMLEDDAGRRDDTQLVADIDSAITPLQEIYSTAYAIGFPQVRQEIASRIIIEQIDLLPLAVGALLLALFLLLRQLVDILVPLFTAGLSILWTFGLMGWLGVPINVVTSTIPILLIVVGSTEDIHLLAEFRHAQAHCKTVDTALRRMAQRMGRTVLLTFLTTCIGFFSVGLSGIEVLVQFGMVAAIGLLFNFAITVISIPAILRLSGHWQLDGGCTHHVGDDHRWANRYWDLLAGNRLQALVLLGICMAIAVVGIPRIDVDHSPADSLGVNSPAARGIAQLDAAFAGLESFSVVLDAGIQDTFLHARYLDELAALQAHIQGLDPALSVTSFVDYLSLLNQALLEDETAGPPASNEEIAELMIFLDPDRVRSHIDPEFRQARILVRHGISDDQRLTALIDEIQAYLSERLDPGLSAVTAGDSVLTLSATRSMIIGQLQSVLLIVTVFVLIVAFIFTDIRVGLVAALPNLFPVLILFGVMGYTGIPLNIGTTMAAAIAIGMAVDDTLHFMLRYNQALRESRSQQQAMQQTLHEEALPVISTSVALTAGFLVFALSDFLPVAQFGLLSALVIVTALIADFVITPLAISTLRLVTLWDMLSSRLKHDIIPSSPLFRGMRPWQIRKFVLSSTLVDYAAGEPIFCRDEDSEAMFLVIKGIVKVTVPDPLHPGAGTAVARFVAGQVFGDIAVLANEKRQTDAIAVSNVTVMQLTRENIRQVTLLHPLIASKLFYNLARDVSCRWVSFISKARGNRSGERSDSDREQA